ncbi:hypothetical protein [Paracoccus binzhouensis]|uniref:hypothetical protein n=1 Tax=Paracoccus binzhouensis TaxID=2796149 RepID=UPI001E289908|nr:hypothetical protein [Paracoccus binzhouensis]
MIVGSARDRTVLGKTVPKAVRKASEQRFRPILLTSLAFGLSVAAAGAAGLSPASRQAS